jgi:hypothetical protein
MNDNFEKPQDGQKTTQESKKAQDNPVWYILLFLAFLVFLKWLSSLFQSDEKRKRTRTPDKLQKEDLRKLYGVDKHTLGKWVEYFCDPSVLSYETYKKRRRLVEEEYLHILASLGIQTDETPVMTKGIIADIAESHTDTLRAWVIQNIDEFNFSIATYDALNVFPPIIAHQILEGFNRPISTNRVGDDT